MYYVIHVCCISIICRQDSLTKYVVMACTGITPTWSRQPARHLLWTKTVFCPNGNQSIRITSGFALRAPYWWGVRPIHPEKVSRIRSWKHLCHRRNHPAGWLQALLPETLPQVEDDRGKEERDAGDARTCPIIHTISANGWSTWSSWEQHVHGGHV